MIWVAQVSGHVQTHLCSDLRHHFMAIWTDMCMDFRTDMCIDTCLHMCVHIYESMFRAVCIHICIHISKGVCTKAPAAIWTAAISGYTTRYSTRCCVCTSWRASVHMSSHMPLHAPLQMFGACVRTQVLAYIFLSWTTCVTSVSSAHGLSMLRHSQATTPNEKTSLGSPNFMP